MEVEILFYIFLVDRESFRIYNDHSRLFFFINISLRGSKIVGIVHKMSHATPRIRRKQYTRFVYSFWNFEGRLKKLIVKTDGRRRINV